MNKFRPFIPITSISDAGARDLQRRYKEDLNIEITLEEAHQRGVKIMSLIGILEEDRRSNPRPDWVRRRMKAIAKRIEAGEE